MPGTLYIVATPIGNLDDISIRAIKALENADIVACEDTRHSGKLLKHLGLKKRLVSYHDHNEADRSTALIEALESGKSVALISDAGMPGISDPGFVLVRSAQNADLKVTVIPGPTAFVTAAVLSGLPTHSLYFGGFLPARKNARRKSLTDVADLRATLAFYESPKRLAASLSDCLVVLGDRRAAVVREMTKIHEEAYRGTLSELAAQFNGSAAKGEVVILIDGEPAAESFENREEVLLDRIADYKASGNDRKAALKQAAKELGYSKSEAYRILEDAKARNDR